MEMRFSVRRNANNNPTQYVPSNNATSISNLHIFLLSNIMYFHVYQIYALFHRNNASFSSFSLYIARSYSSRRLVCTSRQALVQIQKIKTAGYSLHIVGNSKGVPARAGLLEYTAAFWYSFISVWDSCDGTIWYSAHIVYIVSTLLAFCIISHCNIWN